MFVVRLRGCEQTSFYSSIKTAEYPTIVGDAVVLVVSHLESHADWKKASEGRQPASTRKHRKVSVRPSHSLGLQKLLQPIAGIEPSVPALLHAPMWQIGFVVHGHVVDMNRPEIRRMH